MEGRNINILLTNSSICKNGNNWILLFSLVLLLCSSRAFAAEVGDNVEANKTDQRLSQTSLVQPNVKRREINKVAIDNESIELGIYFGIYSAEDFGTNSVTGFRLAYLVTEDIFFEATIGQTETSKSSAETLGLIDIISDRQLTYYDINVGFNLLPGEVFIGESMAFNIAVYFLGGIGTTEFNAEKRSTVVMGGGFRLLAQDWLAFHVDVRDHVFKQNVFLEEKTTHNIELTASITLFF
ncbi:MAG: outer membrane beta-barrel domain-containing protein [Thiohalomonadales bacterium]